MRPSDGRGLSLRREAPIALLSALLLLTACATEPPVKMYVPTDEEVAACEAQGGTIEPAYALDTYVCLLPAEKPPAAQP